MNRSVARLLAMCALISACGGGGGSVAKPLAFEPGRSISEEPLIDVSCVSRSFCAAAYSQGDVETFDGSSWGHNSDLVAPYDEVQNGRGFFQSMACVTATFCAVGNASSSANNVALFDGSKWTSASVGRNGVDLNEVACPTSDYCVALSAPNENSHSMGVYIYDGTNWSARIAADGVLNGKLACSKDKFCLLVGDNGSRVLDPSSRIFSSNVSYGSSYPDMNSLACVSKDFCWAGDFKGDGYFWNGKSWGAPKPISPASSTSDGIMTIACTTKSFCAAGDGQGSVSTYDGKVWHLPRKLAESSTAAVLAISCVDPAWCVAITRDNKVFMPASQPA